MVELNDGCIETACRQALNECFYMVFIAAGEGKERIKRLIVCGKAVR